MKRIAVLFLVCLCITGSVASAGEAALTVNTDHVVSHVDEKIYGHFLEHIYHSVNGGLWGDMVWNRSFESAGGRGRWAVQNGELVQKSPGTDIRCVFGDRDWTDYEFSLEAKKTGGAEGFLILFRVESDEQFYWLNLGGWGNQRHQLERGRKGEGRWHAVGPAVEGSIATGKWYDIRVRVDGKRIQAWLDGQKLIEWTDGDKAVLKGRVGVGTWSTQARFRNLKVTTLDGDVVYEGVPDMAKSIGAGENWQTFGDGNVSQTQKNPLNSDWCIHVQNDRGETGVEQTPLCIRQGERYSGSLWARGKAAEGLEVSLLDGDQVLARRELPGPTGEWREYQFEFAPKNAAREATFRVAVRGDAECWLDQVSMMSESSREHGGFRPDLLNAVKELRPPIIRWPGGCFVWYYRWKDGIGPQHERQTYPVRLWDDRDVMSFGTDEFIDLCRRVGAEPLIVVNIGMFPDRSGEADYLQEAKDWVQYCNGPADSEWGKVRAQNGHPEPYDVKYWEIDNETWQMGVEDYVEAVKRFAPALKEVDPSIEIAACGSGSYNLQWNRRIIEGCGEHIDYLSIHHYENPNNFAEGPRNYEEFFRKTQQIIENSDNPDMKIYVSEWNAQSTDWRTGLYAGGLLNAFERCSDVLEIGGPALFLRHVDARAWDNAFINFNQCTWFPAPNYVVMKLWRDHYAPHLLKTEGNTADLNVATTRSADSSTLYCKVVNPSEESRDVNLTLEGDFDPASGSFELVAPDSLSARNTLEEPHSVHRRGGEVELVDGNVRFTMPPLSAGVVTLRK